MGPRASRPLPVAPDEKALPVHNQLSGPSTVLEVSNIFRYMLTIEKLHSPFFCLLYSLFPVRSPTPSLAAAFVRDRCTRQESETRGNKIHRTDGRKLVQFNRATIYTSPLLSRPSLLRCSPKGTSHRIRWNASISICVRSMFFFVFFSYLYIKQQNSQHGQCFTLQEQISIPLEFCKLPKCITVRLCTEKQLHSCIVHSPLYAKIYCISHSINNI